MLGQGPEFTELDHELCRIVRDINIRIDSIREKMPKLPPTFDELYERIDPVKTDQYSGNVEMLKKYIKIVDKFHYDIYNLIIEAEWLYENIVGYEKYLSNVLETYKRLVVSYEALSKMAGEK
ncbi:hypothetical protein Tsac_2830 [Thermoanaerobacterium phage THSA-485A]|uniref:hypothetical protein n=1 Tax=Thermoanaerobacterium phage THSA-485A TaxID=1126885 RepID=UPI000263F827|nr:hypothetical protein Tsac_2830 [Thermoanaerobacterium phage THSA-485A]AFK87683.1 hypothetical protein Tsac_2830 [Thermoanaerobacterium phage THSA-485A]